VYFRLLCCVVCCAVSGFCDELITRLEESYRVSVCVANCCYWAFCATEIIKRRLISLKIGFCEFGNEHYGSIKSRIIFEYPWKCWYLKRTLFIGASYTGKYCECNALSWLMGWSVVFSVRDVHSYVKEFCAWMGRWVWCYFRDWWYQCAKAITFLKSNIRFAEFSDLSPYDPQVSQLWAEKTYIMLSCIYDVSHDWNFTDSATTFSLSLPLQADLFCRCQMFSPSVSNLWLTISLNYLFWCSNNSEVKEKCDHLCHYAASSGNSIPTFRDRYCPETAVRNCHYSLRSSPEERSSRLLHGGSLKPHELRI
jgi:hypothetical protein